MLGASPLGRPGVPDPEDHVPAASARRRALAVLAAVVASVLTATSATAATGSDGARPGVSTFDPRPQDAAGPGAPGIQDSAQLAPVVRAGDRVLFVGNSFTQGFEEPTVSYGSGTVDDLNDSGTGGVPGIVSRLSANLGVPLDISLEAVGGQSLQWHLENRPHVFDEPWDAVVAQEFSLSALPAAHGGSSASFHAAARTMHERVRAASSATRTVLFETWASPTSVRLQGYGEGPSALRAMQDDLDAAYADEALTTGWTRTAPVGAAFVRAVEEGAADGTPADGVAPGTARLWSAQDDRHAAAAGSYLAAAVLTATLTHRNPQLLPVGPGSAASELGLDARTAAALNRVAAESVPVPLAVDAVSRDVCSPRASVVRVQVRNHDDVPVRVRVPGVRGIPNPVVQPDGETVVAVPVNRRQRLPSPLSVSDAADGRTDRTSVRVSAEGCLGGG
ncbi:hypothetical protein [Microbacterium enclense]|uniref:hypothetical protein n=1 Tax=Microbacterium enclense TaxID=993073 RepID=UPI0036DBE584